MQSDKLKIEKVINLWKQVRNLNVRDKDFFINVLQNTTKHKKKRKRRCKLFESEEENFF